MIGFSFRSCNDFTRRGITDSIVYKGRFLAPLLETQNITYLCYNIGREVVILTQSGFTHESENRHDTMKYEVRGNACEARYQQQSRLLGLKTLCSSQTVNEHVRFDTSLVKLQAR